MTARELDRLQRLRQGLRCSRFNTLEDARAGQGLVHLIPPNRRDGTPITAFGDVSAVPSITALQSKGCPVDR
ncbi:hypothetical protein Lesp02_51830 [Lentzea sp. NBRC 105346]|nr:hypothetical protein Lesp02_51830 [Lentzea sp. NBRC 105346]